MYAASLKFDDPKILVDGKARIRFSGDDGKTRLADLYQRDPVRVLFPETPNKDLPQAVVVTTSGGLVGGDRISIEAKAEEGVRVLVTSQAAEKIYRSAGEDSLVNIKLEAGPNSWLEYLPQETILFDGARLRRGTTLEVAASGRLLAGEILVFGRLGGDEKYTHGLVHDAWDVLLNGRLKWADALHLSENTSDVLSHEACFGGAVAMATVVYVGPDAGEHLEMVHDLLNESETSLTGATLVNGILVVRWLSEDAYKLRTQLGNFWRTFRCRAADLPDALPRLWNV